MRVRTLKGQQLGQSCRGVLSQPDLSAPCGNSGAIKAQPPAPDYETTFPSDKAASSCSEGQASSGEVRIGLNCGGSAVVCWRPHSAANQEK